jgi:cytochrome c oxidase assembly factor CtaG
VTRPRVVSAGALTTWFVATAASVAAHGVGADAAESPALEPTTLLVLGVAAGAYALGAWRLRRAAGPNRALDGRRTAAFASGLIALAAALASPVVWWSSQLFAVHMVQHVVLMLIAAPLLILGDPGLALIWALPRRTRLALSHVVPRGRTEQAWRVATAPAGACALFAITLWVWHLPVLFEAALASDALHALQHASFLGSALLFWWGVLRGRTGRSAYGAGVIYVFLTAVQSGLLSAVLVFSPNAWYSAYSPAERLWRLEPLADQQLAGLLMWIPASVIFIAAGLTLVALWVRSSDRHALQRRGSTISGTAGAPRSGRRSPG